MLNHKGTDVIETERLILRKFQYSDVETVLKNWASDKEVQSFYSEPTYENKEAVIELLDKYITNYQNNNYYRWAIISRENNECIGQIAYFLLDNSNNFGEIEYCIGKEFQGNGYATEGTMAVIAYGFENINLHKVQICHKAYNEKSKRVIEKCGLSYDGKLRDYFYENGRYIDRLYYSILKSEYEKLTKLAKNTLIYKSQQPI